MQWPESCDATTRKLRWTERYSGRIAEGGGLRRCCWARCGGTWEALESKERGALVHTQLIEKAATFLRAAERRLAGKFKATAERRGGGRQQRGRRWQNGEAMAAEVIEQIDSKATQIGADEGAGIPVLRSKCRIKDLTASTLEG